MPQVHRLGDIDSSHGCPPGGEGSAPTTMPAVGSPNVIANGQSVVRFGDVIIPHSCTKGGPHSGTFLGMRNVYVNGKPVQAVGDIISCTSFAITGSPNVIVG